MSKTIYSCTVRKENNVWIISTELDGIGTVEAEAEFDWQIDRHARLNICDFTEEDPFDFDLRYEFIGEAPRYLIRD